VIRRRKKIVYKTHKKVTVILGIQINSKVSS
jgi:hypothetical protein